MKIKIDVDDAVDRLGCMSREIVINKHLPAKLKTSLERDQKLLKALIPLVRSLKSLKG